MGGEEEMETIGGHFSAFFEPSPLQKPKVSEEEWIPEDEPETLEEEWVLEDEPDKSEEEWMPED